MWLVVKHTISCQVSHSSVLILFPEQWRCREEGFQCHMGNPTCINSTLLCDGHKHCSDDSDEGSCGGLQIQLIIYTDEFENRFPI